MSRRPGLFALAALLCGIGSITHAQASEETDPLQFEIGYQHMFHDGGSEVVPDDSIALPDVSLGTVILRASYHIEAMFAIESELMFGVSEGTGTVSTPQGDIPFEIGIKHGIAVLGKVRYPAFEGGIVHARLGGAALRLTSSLPGYSSTETSESLAYGVGGEFMIREQLRLRADFTQYRDNGETINAASVSLVHHF